MGGLEDPAAGAGAHLQLGPEFQISEDTRKGHPRQGQPPGAAGEPGAGEDGFQGGDAGSVSMRGTGTPGMDRTATASPTKAAGYMAGSLLPGQLQGSLQGCVLLDHSFCVGLQSCLGTWVG